MDTVEVRAALMTDAPAIARINLDFESENVRKAQVDEMFDDVSIEFRRVRLPRADVIPFQQVAGEILDDFVRNGEVLVATVEGRVVGFLHLGINPGHSCIRLELGGVNKQQRGNGIGSALLTSAEAVARAQGIRRIAILLQAKNDSGIHFVRKRGYKFCGYEEAYFPNMEIALIYSKNIR